MKLEISTPLMQAVSNKLVKAVSTKDIIPSLKNFLIKAEDKNIHIVAGDSATYLEKDIPCNSIQETGVVSVDGKAFTKLINKINSETIILETTDDNRLRIKAGKSKFHLAVIDPDEYVYPEDLVPDVEGIQITLPDLKRAFKLGAITVSKNATEVYFTAYKVGKVLMTTNRNNLTIYNTNVCEDDLLVTQDTVNLINDMDGETATIAYTQDFIEIKTEGTRILGNLLCGLENFPPDNILESFSYNHQAVVSKKVLLPVLDRALIFIKDLGSIELKFNEKVIECKLVGTTDSDTYEEIPFEGNVPNGFSIYVNVGMLYNIASALDSDTLELHVDCENEGSPLLVKSSIYQAILASMIVE